MNTFRYSKMDRKGKPNNEKKMRGNRYERFLYMKGYIDAKFESSPSPIILKKWYKNKFGLGKTTLYKDIKELSNLYPGIFWF